METLYLCYAFKTFLSLSQSITPSPTQQQLLIQWCDCVGMMTFRNPDIIVTVKTICSDESIYISVIYCKAFIQNWVDPKLIQPSITISIKLEVYIMYFSIAKTSDNTLSLLFSKHFSVCLSIQSNATQQQRLDQWSECVGVAICLVNQWQLGRFLGNLFEYLKITKGEKESCTSMKM